MISAFERMLRISPPDLRTLEAGVERSSRYASLHRSLSAFIDKARARERWVDPVAQSLLSAEGAGLANLALKDVKRLTFDQLELLDRKITDASVSGDLAGLLKSRRLVCGELERRQYIEGLRRGRP